MKKLFTLTLCLLGLLTAHSQKAGTLDSSFGSKGRVFTDFEGGNPLQNAGRQVLLQKDGAYILVAELEQKVVLYRYLPNSGLDKNFGTQGHSEIGDIFFGFTDNIQQGGDIAVQQGDGKIVVAGTLNSNFALIRFNLDGTIDKTFGDDGIDTIDFGGEDVPSGLVKQKDGKMILVGLSSGNYAFARCNEDGSLDSTLNGTGKTIVTVSGYQLIGRPSVAVQMDGKILLAGTSSGFVVLRYDKNGSIDSAFGKNGIVTTKFLHEGEDATSITIQDNGKILVAGETSKQYQQYPTIFPLALARYNTNGSLDKTFGKAGKVITAFDWNLNTALDPSYYLVKVKSNGKIVVAGAAKNKTEIGCSIVQFDNYGSLDSTFGKNGIVITNNERLVGNIASIVFQPDEKIILTGRLYNYLENYRVYYISRYDNNGFLDSSFAKDGKLYGYFPIQRAGLNAITLNSGKIRTAGATDNPDVPVADLGNSDFAVATYNEKGSPDLDFGMQGIVVTDFAGSSDVVRAIATQPDGKIVVAGRSNVASGGTIIEYSGFALARYRTDGSLDSNFGTNGKVTTFFDQEQYTEPPAVSLAIQKDGKLVLAGGEVIPDYHQTFVVLTRYHVDGSLDSSFGDGGKVMTDFGEDAWASSMVLQKDGKIVVAGTQTDYDTYNLILARYNIDGSLDKKFGDNGKLITKLGSQAEAASIAIPKDGKLIVAGTIDTIYNYDLYPNNFVLIRYAIDGKIDSTFGEDGIVITDFGGFDHASSMKIEESGKIVVAGSSNTGNANAGDFALARYNPNGSLDSSFGENGKLTTDLGGNDDAAALSISHNNLYVAGTSSSLDSNGFLLSRGVVAAYNLSCIKQAFYKDKDGDGYGDITKKVKACTPPEGYVPDSTDCNDNNASAHPGATEICNGLDDNCDGQIDEGCSSLPFLTINNVKVYESEGAATLTVSLSKKSDHPVSVFYFTYDGTATGFPWASDRDYVARAGVLTIPANSQTGTIEIKIMNDGIQEPEEYFYVRLIGAFNATISDVQGRVTIKDGTEPLKQIPIAKENLWSKELPSTKLEVKVYPNPSTSSFTIIPQSPSNTTVTLRVIDAVGRVIETRTGISPNSTLQIGIEYPPGMYYAIVMQGKERVVLKPVKQSK